MTDAFDLAAAIHLHGLAALSVWFVVAEARRRWGA
jgi:hypothetical protein